jgi:hypothetical protein
MSHVYSAHVSLVPTRCFLRIAGITGWIRKRADGCQPDRYAVNHARGGLLVLLPLTRCGRSCPDSDRPGGIVKFRGMRS